jgi:hypothetical protein
MESQVEACMQEESVLAAAASSSDSNTEEVECNDWFDNFTPPTTVLCAQYPQNESHKAGK